MARKVVQILNAEAGIIQELLSERDAVAKSLSIAVNMVLARHEIGNAVFVGLNGNEVYLDVEDKPDRTDSPKTGRGVVGVISGAPAPETPSGGQPAGKADVLAPVVDAPDAGKPATVPGKALLTDGGPVDSMGKDTGPFPNDLPGVDSTLREHGG